ncbi:hypothetical protein AVEN_175384-1 [Araneus ventricosus]|uniref:C3H1-type domain-containing protein n=1 Tax=Araneus ventricosus TaxID=182803 RepID=A0A4Y2V339_ARAVE|nr:hypothetical protein AVEN_175384-1 [Araneus ventricosus]
MELKTATYHPLAPRSYIPLPSKLAAKKAVINIKNTDQKCFIWSVLAALHPVGQNAERVSHYLPLEQELRLGNATCPVQPCKLPIVENLSNLRINVFSIENGRCEVGSACRYRHASVHRERDSRRRFHD